MEHGKGEGGRMVICKDDPHGIERGGKGGGLLSGGKKILQGHRDLLPSPPVGGGGKDNVLTYLSAEREGDLAEGALVLLPGEKGEGNL